MAANMRKTLRVALNLARCAEDDSNNKKVQEDELNKRARERAQTMVKHQSGENTRTNQAREQNNHKYYRQERETTTATQTDIIKANCQLQIPGL